MMLAIGAVWALALATGAGAYEGTGVTGGGTVKGQVKYGGVAPAREKIEVTKDAAKCGAEGPKLKEDLVVGAGGGIANAVVHIKGITKGKAFKTDEPPTLDQRVCQFRPHVTLVPAGGTLSVLNSDGILHNVHTYGEANAPVNKAQPGFKKQIQIEFAKPETMRVECDAHPWMKGWIVVQDDPYYAVTDENGNFSIAEVPAGTYEVEVWQETLGKQTASVTVSAGGEAVVAVGYPGK
jgi:plastocyanin